MIAHLVTVWNPGYASSAMEAHLEVLLRWARRFRHRGDEDVSEDDVYVWWGKVRSQNRQQPLEHLHDILQASPPLDSNVEQHVYLTDYRSLYVAHLSEITTDDPREDDAEHVPGYYADARLNCDCWFKLWDIRRLVSDDTIAVVEELAQLRNTRYHDRPVSLYGGMVELPLIVSREPNVDLFAGREFITEGQMWAEFDSERSGTGAMEKELRENLLGETVWRRLDPAARTFLATAETIFRRNRDDPAFDFAPVVIDLAKAVELQAGKTVAWLLRKAPPLVRRVMIDGRTFDLATGGLTLGQLPYALENADVSRTLKQSGRGGHWVAESLAAILRELAPLRNRAAHSARASLQETLTLRNRLLGVGREGVITLLANAGAR